MTLEQHALAYRLRGLPYYDEMGNEIGIVSEREWELSKLSVEDEIVLGKSIFAALDSPQRPASLSDRDVYLWVMADYGVKPPWIMGDCSSGGYVFPLELSLRRK